MHTMFVFHGQIWLVHGTSFDAKSSGNLLTVIYVVWFSFLVLSLIKLFLEYEFRSDEQFNFVTKTPTEICNVNFMSIFGYEDRFASCNKSK